MREILWIAAIVVVATLLWKGLSTSSGTNVPEDEWFATNVVADSQTKPVIVKFGAEWCGPCKQMEPELDSFAADLGDRVKVVKIDVDEHRDLAAKFGVSGIPHTLVVLEGKVVGSEVGMLNAAQLKEWTQEWVAAR
jgi:thioredoxin 1